MEEIWRPVVGFEGVYEVSNRGRVRSLDRLITTKRFQCQRDGKILIPFDNGGYLRVALGKHSKKYLVHRLVARAFPEICGEWFEGCVINHKNMITSDNRAENIETCTIAYNNTYKPSMEKRVKTILRNGKKRQRVAKIDDSNNIIAVYDSQTECAEQNNISKGNLCSVLNNYYGRKTIGGFKYVKL